MKEYEEMLKSLMASIRRARAAAESVQGLEDKLRFQRLSSKLKSALKILRVQYYEFEDAVGMK